MIADGRGRTKTTEKKVWVSSIFFLSESNQKRAKGQLTHITDVQFEDIFLYGLYSGFNWFLPFCTTVIVF